MVRHGKCQSHCPSFSSSDYVISMVVYLVGQGCLLPVAKFCILHLLRKHATTLFVGQDEDAEEHIFG